MGGELSTDHILRELSGLWASMAKTGESGAEAGSGVLRACTMTLVVLSEAAEDAAALGETIAALMPEHPARAILVRLAGDGPRVLEERVYAQCWMPFGQRRQICCEQIEITASDAALPDLPATLLPLAAADLPVILWCRAPRLLGRPEFRVLAAMADKVVLDSAALPDALAALRLLADEARAFVLADLAWTRLTRWREMLAQVFENRKRLAQLPAVSRVRVGYGPTYESGARYLAAWIARCLGQCGATAKTTVGQAEGTLEIEMEGPDLRIALVRRGETLVVTVNEISQYTSLSVPGDCMLMREELGIVVRDPVFETTLSLVARQAYPTD